MKTADERAREVMHEAKWTGERYPDDGGAMLRRITLAIAEAMADSATHAIRNVPPLPMLLVDDVRAKMLQQLTGKATPGPWYPHHTDDSLFMNCYTVSTSASEPNTEDGGNPDVGKLIAGTLIQSEVHVGLTEGGWAENVRFIAEARTAVDDLLADRETLLRMFCDCDSIDAYVRGHDAGWRSRIIYGEWMTLERLRDGAIFETRDGIRAVKSEYRYSNDNPNCQCILLASGEYAHFNRGNLEAVREIHWEDES